MPFRGVETAAGSAIERLPSEPVHLRLLGGFALVRGARALELPVAVQRLVAFLALERVPRRRGYVAGVLWPDVTADHASGSLRSALWRLGRIGPGIVRVSTGRLELGTTVSVDVDDLAACARRLDSAGAVPTESDFALASLARDMLVDWYDDWLVYERERILELGLQVLETGCQRLLDVGRFGEALRAAHAAVRIEPLRESAHRAVVRVHLAQGNVAVAIRQYRLYRAMLQTELALEPSAEMERLVHALRHADPV